MCHLLEAGRREALQDFLAVGLAQVLPHLHNDVVAWHQASHRINNSPDAVVVHTRHAVVERRLVDGAPPALATEHARARCPLDDLAVRELHILRVLLQEGVQPLEGALVGEADRQNDLVLPVLALRCLRLDGVGVGCSAQHAAREGKRLDGLGAPVRQHLDVAESEVREKRLSLETLGQGLRLTSADTVDEQTDGVIVLALGVQVQQNADGLVPEELPADGLPRLAHAKAAVRVEEDLLLAVAEHERRARRGEADAHRGPARGCALAVEATCVRKRQDFQDPGLEHVSASLHANVRTGTGDEVLTTSVRERCQDPPAHGRDHVQRRVRHVEADLAREGLAAVRRSIHLLLRDRLDLGLLRGRLRGGGLLGLLLLRLALLRLLLLLLLLVVVATTSTASDTELAGLPHADAVGLVLQPRRSGNRQVHLGQLRFELLFLGAARDLHLSGGAAADRVADGLGLELVGRRLSHLVAVLHPDRNHVRKLLGLAVLGTIHPPLAEEVETLLVLHLEEEQRIACEELCLEDDVVGAGHGDDVHRGLHGAADGAAGDAVLIKGLEGAIADESLVLLVEHLFLGLLGVLGLLLLVRHGSTRLSRGVA
mmetsp:Transcript_69278/g.195557  ORF Transcript_69278/g.195557 Transcript_69278/m.195557 type:complete len:598 (-) Transcript_69278:41-1834(-)